MHCQATSDCNSFSNITEQRGTRVATSQAATPEWSLPVLQQCRRRSARKASAGPGMDAALQTAEVLGKAGSEVHRSSGNKRRVDRVQIFRLASCSNKLREPQVGAEKSIRDMPNDCSVCLRRVKGRQGLRWTVRASGRRAACERCPGGPPLL